MWPFRRVLNADGVRKMREKGNVVGLIDALRNANPRTALPQSIIEALGHLADRRAVQPLCELLRDPDWRLRRSAAEALDKIGIPDDASVQAWHAVAKEDWERATAIGVPSIEPLCFVITQQTGSSLSISGAVRALGMIADQSGVKTLEGALLGKSIETSRAAAWALAHIGGAGAAEALCAGLRNYPKANEWRYWGCDRPSPASLIEQRRQEAAEEALVKIGDDAIPVLCREIARDLCGRACLNVLISIGSPADLRAASKNCPRHLRQDIADALSKMENCNENPADN